MREHMTQRRAELQAEHEKGAQMLATMERERVQLEQTMLRIAGALAMLDELLRTAGGAAEGVTNGDNL